MWKLNYKKSILPLKKTQSQRDGPEQPPQFDRRAEKNNDNGTFSLAQLAARGDLDIDRENAAKQNVMKSFDFEDENMINDVMNTEKYLLNDMPSAQPMSNLKPLSKLLGQNMKNPGQSDYNFANQISTFLRDQNNFNNSDKKFDWNQSSIIKKKSFLENPDNEYERRKQLQGDVNTDFVNKTPPCQNKR